MLFDPQELPELSDVSVGAAFVGPVRAARAALLAGQPETCLELLGAVPEVEPAAALLRGWALLARGDLYRAEGVLRVLADRQPDGFEAHHWLGRVYALQEDDARANAELQAALALRPDHPGALAALAEVHNREGALDRAEALARRGLRLAPDSTALLSALAGSLRRQERHAEAIDVLQRARQQAEGDEDIHVALGRSLLALRRPGEGRRLFEEVLHRNTDSVGALAGMAEALEMEGRLQDATGYVLRAVAAAPDRAPLHLLNARLNLRSGRFEAAENAALTAATLEPTDADALRIAMHAAARLGRPRRAAMHADRVIALRPNDADARAHQALIAVLDGRPETAISLLQSTPEAHGSAEAQRAWGCAALASGDPEAAAWRFKEALRLRADSNNTQALLELAWEAQSDRSRSVLDRLRLLLSGPATAGALRALVGEPREMEEDPGTSAERPVTGPIAPLVQAAVNRLLSETGPRRVVDPPPATSPVPDSVVTASSVRLGPPSTVPPSARPITDVPRAVSSAPPAALEPGGAAPPDLLSRLHRLRVLLQSEPLLAELLGRVGQLIDSYDTPLLLAVLGPPGAGKTTFVNALIGEELIPIDTGVPYLLRYGRRAGGRVLFRDGRVEAHELNALRTEMAERRLSAVEVLCVEVLLPIEELARASILDAPDPLAPTTDDALLWHADGVIWLVGSDQSEARWAEAAAWLGHHPMTAIGVVTRADIAGALDLGRITHHLGDRVDGLVAVSARAGLDALARRDVPALRASGFTALHRLMRDVFFDRAAQIRTETAWRRTRTLLADARDRVAQRRRVMESQANGIAALAERVERDRRDFANEVEGQAGRRVADSLDEAIVDAAQAAEALWGVVDEGRGGDALRGRLRAGVSRAVGRVRRDLDRRLSDLIRSYFEAFDAIFPGAEQSAEAARVAGLQGILDGYRMLLLEEAFGRYQAYLEGWTDAAPLHAVFDATLTKTPGIAALIERIRTRGLRLEAARQPSFEGLGRPLFDGIAEFIEETATELRLSRLALSKRLDEPLERLEAVQADIAEIGRPPATGQIGHLPG
ncbi:MAG: tetratricopeptide repeat protein [Myxococcales bacterium]|nr:tetratricopeptide repeat protein [Myxococcales bacterium]